MKNILCLLLLFITCNCAYAISSAKDTVVITDNGALRFRVITHEEFFRTPAKAISDNPMRSIYFDELHDAFAGVYEFEIETDDWGESNLIIRKGGEEHIKLSGIDKDYIRYYPQDDIIISRDTGHHTDLAVFLSSGENISAFDPSQTIRSWDRKYRLTSRYTGQDSDVYTIWRDGEDFVTLSDIIRGFPFDIWGYPEYIYDAYFHDGTLYYKTVRGEWNNLIPVWVAVELEYRQPLKVSAAIVSGQWYYAR